MMGVMTESWERWHAEGMPSWVDSEGKICEYFGFDGVGFLRQVIGKDGRCRPTMLPFKHMVGFYPPFPVQVVQETEDYTITTDSMGCTRKQIKGVATAPLHAIIVDYPMKEARHWLTLKRRLQFSENRLTRKVVFEEMPGSGSLPVAVDWTKRYEELRTEGLPVGVNINGFFEFPRNLMGPLTLLKAYYREPDLIHDILDTYSDLIVAVAERMLASIEVDCFYVSDLLASGQGPMISPKLFREFWLPYYRRVADPFRQSGTKIFSILTEGDSRVLIPLFIEAGINTMVLAGGMPEGDDVVDLRRRYGTNMAFVGGLNKRALLDFDAIDAELEAKLPFMLKTGGYHPGLDHRS